MRRRRHSRDMLGQDLPETGAGFYPGVPLLGLRIGIPGDVSQIIQAAKMRRRGNIGQREYTFEDISRRISKHKGLLLIDAGHAGIRNIEEPALQIARNPHILRRIKNLDFTL